MSSRKNWTCVFNFQNEFAGGTLKDLDQVLTGGYPILVILKFEYLRNGTSYEGRTFFFGNICSFGVRLGPLSGEQGVAPDKNTFEKKTKSGHFPVQQRAVDAGVYSTLSGSSHPGAHLKRS